MDLKQRSQRSRRILEESDSRLTTSDVNQFLTSPLVESAKAHFEYASSGRTLSTHALCEARDYLLIMITLRTGTRPRVLENAMVDDYHSMRQDPATGHSSPKIRPPPFAFS